MTDWSDFPLELQKDAGRRSGVKSDGLLTPAEAEMACGLTCLRMIERWATNDKRKPPTTYREWLRMTRDTQQRYLDKGVKWKHLYHAATEQLNAHCTWTPIKKSDFPEIPKRLAGLGEKYEATVVLAQVTWYWPRNNKLIDCGHYIILTRVAEGFVCVADPVRTYLVFENWEQQLGLIKAAALVTRSK